MDAPFHFASKEVNRTHSAGVRNYSARPMHILSFLIKRKGRALLLKAVPPAIASGSVSQCLQCTICLLWAAPCVLSVASFIPGLLRFVPLIQRPAHTVSGTCCEGSALSQRAHRSIEFLRPAPVLHFAALTTTTILPFISANERPPAAFLSYARLCGHWLRSRPCSTNLPLYLRYATARPFTVGYFVHSHFHTLASRWLLATSFLPQSLQSFRFERRECKQ